MEVSRLALPLLTDAVQASLREWSAAAPPPAPSSEVSARASQLSAMLTRLTDLRLPVGTAHPPAAGQAAVSPSAARRRSECAHLVPRAAPEMRCGSGRGSPHGCGCVQVALAPDLINAIGRPTSEDGGALAGREVQRLQEAIREALQLVFASLPKP